MSLISVGGIDLGRLCQTSIGPVVSIRLIAYACIIYDIEVA